MVISASRKIWNVESCKKSDKWENNWKPRNRQRNESTPRREIIQYKTAYIEFVSVVEVEPEIIPKKSKDLLKSKKYIISKIPIVLQTVVHENFEIFLCRYLDLEAKTKKDCKAAIKELLNN